MRLDAARARAVAADVAHRLKMDVLDLAEGVVQIANANMERATRVVSVEQGHDPRRFALLAFGGAGGMHACEIAQRLDIATVIVPRHAGAAVSPGHARRRRDARLLRQCVADQPRIDRGRHHQTICLPLLAQGTRELQAEGFKKRPAVDRAPGGRAIRRAVVRNHTAIQCRLSAAVRPPARAPVWLLECRAADRGGRGPGEGDRRYGEAAKAAIYSRAALSRPVPVRLCARDGSAAARSRCRAISGSSLESRALGLSGLGRRHRRRSDDRGFPSRDSRFTSMDSGT